MNEDYLPAGLSELIEKFLLYKDVKENSRDVYCKCLKYFYAWVDENYLNPKSIKRDDIINYKSYLQKNYSVYTVRLYLTVLKSFYRWMEATLIDKNICIDIRNPRYEKRIYKMPLDVKQAKQLCSIIDTNTLRGLRDLAIIKLMLHNGLRRIEINRLNINDVNQAEGKIKIFGKGCYRPDQVMNLDYDALSSINSYLSRLSKIIELSDEDPLFINISYNCKFERLSTKSISEIIRNYLKQIGLNSGRYSSHSLRHTCATTLLQSGIDIYSVRDWLRHSSVLYTETYVRQLSEIKKQKDNYGQLLAEKFKI